MARSNPLPAAEPKVEPRLATAERPITVGAAIESFIADCRSRNLSRNTVQLNALILRHLAERLDSDRLTDISAEGLRRFFIEKATETTACTAARYHNTISAFFKFLAEERFITENPMLTVKRPKFANPLIEPLTQDQVEAILAACGGNAFLDVRDRLILLTLVDSGLRASELAALTLADVDWNNQTFHVRHGKGDKARRVPFGETVAATLRQYLARRANLETTALLVTRYGEPIDRFRLRAIIKARAEKAGVNHPHMGPHLLRHTCAVSYLRAGGDAFTLQRILGHVDLKMTRRYVELSQGDVSAKHRLFSPADRLNVKAALGRKRIRREPALIGGLPYYAVRDRITH